MTIIARNPSPAPAAAPTPAVSHELAAVVRPRTAIAVREQQIAAAADALKEQISTLSDQLHDLEAEACDLAVARLA